MAAVRLEGVWKRYGAVTAVENLCLACNEGEMLALLGPSGCGKSSTLKMIAGVEDVSAGEIFLGERPVSRLAPGGRNIAMLFEDYALYPHLTVRENVLFPLQVRGVAKREAARRADDVLSLLGLTDHADLGVRALSGGAQQRVSIGRALVRDPDLILLDEPLSHLDADQKIQLRIEIKRLQKISNVTSILVTHDQTEATAMADRIAVMESGVLQQVATARELYEQPANIFVAGFIGEPPMNLVRVEVSDDGGRLAMRNGSWTTSLAERHRGLLAKDGVNARALIAGVRPEHVIVGPRCASADGLAIVRTCEPRGDTDVVVLAPLDEEGLQLVAEVPGPSDIRAEDVVSVSVMAEHVHLFDPTTTRNLQALS